MGWDFGRVYFLCHIATKNRLCKMAVLVYTSASKLTYFRRGPEDFIKFKYMRELFSVEYYRIYRKGRPSVTAELLIFSGV